MDTVKHLKIARFVCSVVLCTGFMIPFSANTSYAQVMKKKNPYIEIVKGVAKDPTGLVSTSEQLMKDAIAVFHKSKSSGSVTGSSSASSPSTSNAKPLTNYEIQQNAEAQAQLWAKNYLSTLRAELENYDVYHDPNGAANIAAMRARMQSLVDQKARELAKIQLDKAIAEQEDRRARQMAAWMKLQDDKEKQCVHPSPCFQAKHELENTLRERVFKRLEEDRKNQAVRDLAKANNAKLEQYKLETALVTKVNTALNEQAKAEEARRVKAREEELAALKKKYNAVEFEKLRNRTRDAMQNAEENFYKLDNQRRNALYSGAKWTELNVRQLTEASNMWDYCITNYNKIWLDSPYTRPGSAVQSSSTSISTQATSIKPIESTKPVTTLTTTSNSVASLGGFNWFEGAKGQKCTAVCSSLGKTFDSSGSGKWALDLNNCKALGAKFRPKYSMGYRGACGAAIGCQLSGSANHLTSCTNYDVKATLPADKPLCSCK